MKPTGNGVMFGIHTVLSLIADCRLMQSQFINQHVTASIIQRNAPTNVWSWEFNVVQRSCPRVLFGGWLVKQGGFVLNQQARCVFT